jgi:hypothetical protein
VSGCVSGRKLDKDCGVCRRRKNPTQFLQYEHGTPVANHTFRAKGFPCALNYFGEPDAQRQRAHLTRFEIPHTFTTLLGVPHNPMQLFQALGGANWQFYRQAFGKP